MLVRTTIPRCQPPKAEADVATACTNILESTSRKWRALPEV